MGEAYRYLQWSKDRAQALQKYADQAVAEIDKEIPTDTRTGIEHDDLGRATYWFQNPIMSLEGATSGHPPEDYQPTIGSPYPEDLMPPLGEFQGIVKSPHWF